MPRLHIAGGETKEIPLGDFKTCKVFITGWLLNAGSDLAILVGNDAYGEIFPHNGMAAEAYEGNGANLEIDVYPPVSFELNGKTASAVIYYKVQEF